MKKGKKMERYKVILVDDEAEVIDMIEKKIHWNDLGFEVASLRCFAYGISQHSASRYDLLPYAHSGTYLRYYLRTSICNYLWHCRPASFKCAYGYATCGDASVNAC